MSGLLSRLYPTPSKTLGMEVGILRRRLYIAQCDCEESLCHGRRVFRLQGASNLPIYESATSLHNSVSLIFRSTKHGRATSPSAIKESAEPKTGSCLQEPPSQIQYFEAPTTEEC